MMFFLQKYSNPSFLGKGSRISTRLFNADYSAKHYWPFLVTQMMKNLPAMYETRVRSLDQEDPLEKEIATNTSILTWRIPWTEETGGLQSMGSQRVGHNLAANTHAFNGRSLSHSPDPHPYPPIAGVCLDKEVPSLSPAWQELAASEQEGEDTSLRTNEKPS